MDSQSVQDFLGSQAVELSKLKSQLATAQKAKAEAEKKAKLIEDAARAANVNAFTIVGKLIVRNSEHTESLAGPTRITLAVGLVESIRRGDFADVMNSDEYLTASFDENEDSTLDLAEVRTASGARYLAALGEDEYLAILSQIGRPRS